MGSNEQIKEALKRYWGYDAFRPKQEEIVRDILGGRDVCVVMPTGGGKSLCYQLPAVLQRGQTAIVVSPLIALMQDQVAQLAQMGIPAALLNSSQSWNEQRETEPSAQGISRQTDRCLYGERDAACPPRHHRSAQTGRPWKIYCQFSPQKSQLPGGRLRFQDAGRKASRYSAQAQRQLSDCVFTNDQA